MQIEKEKLIKIFDKVVVEFKTSIITDLISQSKTTTLSGEELDELKYKLVDLLILKVKEETANEQEEREILAAIGVYFIVKDLRNLIENPIGYFISILKKD